VAGISAAWAARLSFTRLRDRAPQLHPASQ
jgi:hypothetical protein